MDPNPTDYLMRYHEMTVLDLRQGLFENINIKKYQNGGRDDCEHEMGKLLDALARELKIRAGAGHIPAKFYFPTGDLMDPGEPFFLKGIQRVFRGKGSPDEMIDVLRLAYRCGRVGKGKLKPTLGSYAEQFLGLDCNGFVGNYFGLSPEVLVGAWATDDRWVLGLDKKKQEKLGWGPAKLATIRYIPLKPRKSVDEADSRDVLVTVTDAGVYEHIATIDNVLPFDDTSLSLRFVKWGLPGDKDKHISKDQIVTFTKGPDKRYGLAFHDGYGWHYLFASPCAPDPAGWGRCGHEEW